MKKLELKNLKIKSLSVEDKTIIKGGKGQGTHYGHCGEPVLYPLTWDVPEYPTEVTRWANIPACN